MVSPDELGFCFSVYSSLITLISGYDLYHRLARVSSAVRKIVVSM